MQPNYYDDMCFPFCFLLFMVKVGGGGGRMGARGTRGKNNDSMSFHVCAIRQMIVFTSINAVE
jgi:hypothetical protein